MREAILAVLEKNSRIDLADLAALLGVTEAEVANEISEMEKERVICGYHTLIIWDKTNNETFTVVFVKRIPKDVFEKWYA